MMMFLFFLSIIRWHSTSDQSQEAQANLFRIYSGDKVGFMNQNGEVVIPPKFFNAGNFSEGLAYARLTGTYGYIDATGKFVIAPQFDYASSFYEGIAEVWIDGSEFCIDKNGHRIFDARYSSISSFENGRAYVKTQTKKMGIIDRSGRIIIDTIYRSIQEFNEGVAVVYGLKDGFWRKGKKGDALREVGVLDSTGKLIVPFGIYNEINNFVNGFARVEIPAKAGDKQGVTAQSGFIDTKGNLIFAIDEQDQSFLDGDIHDGLAKMFLYKYWIPEEPGIISTSEKDYQGFVDLHGKVVINDTNYKYVDDFAEGRAFVQDHEWKHRLINKRGDLVTQHLFDGVSKRGFTHDLAFVEVHGEWGAIDTNGNFVIAPHYDGIAETGIIDSFFFFSEPDTTDKSNYGELYGMSNLRDHIIISPIMQQFNQSGFDNGLLSAEVNGKLTYFDKTGKVIWSESQQPTELSNLNVDFMSRGYCYALSSTQQISGGHSIDRYEYNFPKEINPSQQFPTSELALIAKIEEGDTFYKSYNGFDFYLSNNTGDTIVFNVQDNRLYLKMQALNQDGKWKDIEYLPRSWCGNSYYNIQLEPHHYWKFVAPIYEGDFKTKMRIQLSYTDRAHKSKHSKTAKKIVIYSNEFNGSVNPGQFWRKDTYNPTDIMDPYND